MKIHTERISTHLAEVGQNFVMEIDWKEQRNEMLCYSVGLITIQGG